MANTKSAQKRIRVSERKRQRNQAVRSKVRTLVKKVQTNIADKTPASPEALKEALRALDMAASKGVIHKNNAARRKSRLTRRYNIANGIGSRTTIKD